MKFLELYLIKSSDKRNRYLSKGYTRRNFVLINYRQFLETLLENGVQPF